MAHIDDVYLSKFLATPKGKHVLDLYAKIYDDVIGKYSLIDFIEDLIDPIRQNKLKEHLEETHKLTPDEKSEVYDAIQMFDSFEQHEKYKAGIKILPKPAKQIRVSKLAIIRGRKSSEPIFKRQCRCNHVRN